MSIKSMLISFRAVILKEIIMILSILSKTVTQDSPVCADVDIYRAQSKQFWGKKGLRHVYIAKTNPFDGIRMQGSNVQGIADE